MKFNSMLYMFIKQKNYLQLFIVKYSNLKCGRILWNAR